MNITILSNVNMDPIKPLLLSSFNEVRTGLYNQVLSELLNLSNTLLQNIDYLWIHLDSAEIPNNIDNGIVEEIQQIIQRVEEMLSANDVKILFSNISLNSFNIFTFAKDKLEGLNQVEADLNIQLFKLSNDHNNFFILDVKSIIQKYGTDLLFDNKYWYLGRIKYSFSGFDKLSQEIFRQVSAINGTCKKVLVLDLDNTIWGGTVGEEGYMGVALGEEGIGKAYRDFQASIKQLKDIGVLLAICSKNNVEDVEEIFDRNPMMVLSLSDFSCIKVNWRNKAENISEIAEELNLGLDSFVFIDDNSVERDIVTSMIPEVSVPGFVDDPSDLRYWFLNDVVREFFGKIKITNEDKDKAEQYMRRTKREVLKKELSIDEYLKSLGIKLTVDINPIEYIQRLTQLTQKTNQFNLTTKRYNELDIEKFILSNDYLVFAFSYEDKFGKEGIIGEIIVDISEKGAALIDTFLLSCRVVGRNIEYVFINIVCNELFKKGFSELNAEYIPTQKNVLVENLLPDMGFDRLKGNQYQGNVESILEKVCSYQIIEVLINET